MAYHKFKDGAGGYFGSFEVFCNENEEWFWWPCYPGCLPESDEPTGPFETEEEAFYDAADPL